MKPITITPEALTDLVYVYEAVFNLEQCLAQLYRDTIVPDLGAGIMGNLTRIYGVIEKLTPLYDSHQDYEDNEFIKLMNSDLSPEEKAARIMESIN